MPSTGLLSRELVGLGCSPSKYLDRISEYPHAKKKIRKKST